MMYSTTNTYAMKRVFDLFISISLGFISPTQERNLRSLSAVYAH